MSAQIDRQQCKAPVCAVRPEPRLRRCCSWCDCHLCRAPSPARRGGCRADTSRPVHRRHGPESGHLGRSVRAVRVLLVSKLRCGLLSTAATTAKPGRQRTRAPQPERGDQAGEERATYQQLRSDATTASRKQGRGSTVARIAGGGLAPIGPLAVSGCGGSGDFFGRPAC